MWKEGKIEEIFREGRDIQKRMMNTKYRSKEDTARIFAKLMFQGKVNAAINFLSEDQVQGILPIDEEVIMELKAKHPPPSLVNEDVLLQGPIDKVSPRYFDGIDETMIKNAARLTRGAAGPSNLDGEQFKMMLVSNKFKKEGKEMREQLATMAKKLATEIIDPKCIESFVACKLIPLNKNPGIRPIGIGEVLRRIIGKLVSNHCKNEIKEAAGPLQTCAGFGAGTEPANHAMINIFEDDNTDAILLIDASNAFNSMNRAIALHNIKVICPMISTFLINSYRKPSRLFITGGFEILSQEGTTQGDPLAMPWYSLNTTTIIHQLRIHIPEIKQVWLADDATSAGKVSKLHEWYNRLETEGNKFGYFVNRSKSWLICKNEEIANDAEDLFKGTVQITTEGKRHLGSVIGSKGYEKEYCEDLVGKWIEDLEKLS